MVYFRCIKCDVRWTKLIDDACPTCASPCQVVEEIPLMNWFRDSEDASRSTRSYRPRTRFAKAEQGQTTTDPITPDSNDSYLDNSYDGDDDRISEQGSLNSEEEKTFMQHLEKLLDSEDADSASDTGISVVRQLGQPDSYIHHLHAAGISGPPQPSSTSEIEKEKINTKQRANICPIYTTESTPSEHKVTARAKIALPAKDQSSINAQNSSKNKKKPRMSRNQRRNLGNKSSAAATKVMPQLELPDPIPSPGPNNGGSGWNDVVGRGNAKAAKKMQNDTLKRANEREFINASSYLSRDNETETPTRERAAIEVRFSMGSAKHDVRRIVPRSALE